MISFRTITLLLWLAVPLVGAGARLWAAESAEKSPIPPTEQQQKALSTLEEVFDLDKKRSDDELLALAGDIFKMAAEVNGRPGERFALLRKAMELASEGGDAKEMLEIIDVIGSEFQIDPLIVQGKMLNGFAAKANTEKRIESLVGAAKTYVRQAVAAEKLEYARNIAALANRTTQRAAGKNMRKEASALRREVDRLADEHRKLEEARATLRSNPSDPDARLIVGSILCFSRGDWPGGLPHLMNSSDVQLAEVAKQELAAPSQPADQARLADDWWAIALKEKDERKQALLLHAGEWYQKAKPTATGLTKVKIDKRLVELATLTQPKPDDKPVRKPIRKPRAVPAMVFWLMADDMDIYHNGKPLREYNPSFRTRPDEARKKQAYSAKIDLRHGDIFTVGGRRGGSYGGTVIVVDAKNQLLWYSNTTDWRVYEPADPERWWMPEVAKQSPQGPVQVALCYGYQAQMRRDYGMVPVPIWGKPTQRFVYMVGVYRGKPKGAAPR